VLRIGGVRVQDKAMKPVCGVGVEPAHEAVGHNYVSTAFCNVVEFSFRTDVRSFGLPVRVLH
jgi:hypothetical protein